MNPARLALILAGAVAAASVGAWAFWRLARWRRKSPAELERLRRLEVNRRGRITGARIVDLIEPELAKPGARLVVYKYELGGVTYEAAQDLSALPDALALARHATEHVASVKYDPKIPTNSIMACEDWCGIPGGKRGAAPASRSSKTPEKAFGQS